MAMQLTSRQRRWLDALLILSTLAVLYIVIGFAAQIFASFGDIFLVFFLAWLLAFILAGPIGWFERALPGLPRAVSVVLVYGLLVGAMLLVVFLVAAVLTRSIAEFIGDLPQIRNNLPEILAPWEARLADVGLEVDLVTLGQSFLADLNGYLRQLAGPLQDVAFASIGVIGNVLFIVIFSVYMAADKDRLFSAVYRLVPAGREPELRLLQTSVYRSFGGFLRGMAAMGVIYAAVAALTSALLGLPFLPVTTAAAGILMAIPFFGPFVSWAPPVLVALFFVPSAVLPAVLIMGAGWMVLMNAVQPRLMQGAVGLHPVVVLASVIIGARVAGIPGAIFGIPIAAVISAFFVHFYRRGHESGTVAERAAQRLEEREGRPVRVPREPDPGVDGDVLDEPSAT
jgi:predicted PurR-regulated permease PerM